MRLKLCNSHLILPIFYLVDSHVKEERGRNPLKRRGGKKIRTFTKKTVYY